MELMYSAMDIPDKRMASSDLVEDFTKNVELVKDSGRSSMLFYIVFMHLFAFFVLDLYAGAVYSFYQQARSIVW